MHLSEDRSENIEPANLTSSKLTIIYFDKCIVTFKTEKQDVFHFIFISFL